MTAALPCIVCGKELLAVSPPSEDGALAQNQPMHGLAFWTMGHYGSTVFDPMDGSTLEVSICDPCVTDARERGACAHWLPGLSTEARQHPADGIMKTPVPAETIFGAER